MEDSTSYYEWLKRKVDHFVSETSDNELAECVSSAPDLFAVLLGLMRDSRVPQKHQQEAACVMSYFLLPTDLIPEAFIGLRGIADDVFFVGLFLEKLRTAGFAAIVEENWHGSKPVYDCVAVLMAKEAVLVRPEIADAFRKAIAAAK